ncbi:MAG: cytochrome c [Chitinophagaceae bacterium]|nr:MAG: cytochrome c [Chitinophagaceae bacterium]
MKIKFLFFFFTTLILSGSVFSAPPNEEGKTIFMTRCAACHNVHRVLTGPALSGVDKRRSIDWIINFVHSSQTVVKSGDQYAVALFEKFNKVPMPDHADLTTDNIKSIVEFIKVESANKPSVTQNFPSIKKPPFIPLSINDYGFFISFFAVVALLVMTLFFAVHSKTIERNMRDKSLPS